MLCSFKGDLYSWRSLVQVQMMIGNGLDYEFLGMLEDFSDLQYSSGFISGRMAVLSAARA